MLVWTRGQWRRPRVPGTGTGAGTRALPLCIAAGTESAQPAASLLSPRDIRGGQSVKGEGGEGGGGERVGEVCDGEEVWMF